MYKCLGCGNLFEEGEEKKWVEPHGEEIMGCPLCGYTYEETIKCEICGSEHLKEDLIEGVCKECFDKHSGDINICYKASESEKETIKINAFLAEMFDSETIEEILIEHLKEVPFYLENHKENMKNFVENDKSWFAERIVEVLKDEVK